MPAVTGKAREILAQLLQRQASWCDDLGSPLYASLLRSAADDLNNEGAVWGVLSGFEGEPSGSALALRFMGAIHRLVLMGKVPDLALHYPSTGGDGDARAAGHAFRKSLVDLRSEIRNLLPRGCQTNEVGRSAALLGGFLEVARRTGKRLRILELGASAGFNLRWDRYRYESGAGGWGRLDSPVCFPHSFELPPPLDRQVEVVGRKGCDVEPIDPTSPEGSLALRSFVWADQEGRFRLLEGAIAVARQVPVEVERVDAATFLERELASTRTGVATVVYHSVFMQYVDPDGRRRIESAIESAASRASLVGPLAYLRMEPGAQTFEVRLTIWPGGGDELLALTRAHGTGVRWLVS
ncbi:MAG: DUF2332 domain-containing protein [Candidatus Dormibacteraeota bacterium]|nr:DUF2332 domain-containing protein [Candidatus Dormibacteraeota bacterium]